MKKDIKELIINPINPRKIVVGQKRRLQQSIMLFPKMLYYRDIIVNKDNVVLAGNQRTTIMGGKTKRAMLSERSEVGSRDVSVSYGAMS